MNYVRWLRRYFKTAHKILQQIYELIVCPSSNGLHLYERRKIGPSLPNSRPSIQTCTAGAICKMKMIDFSRSLALWLMAGAPSTHTG